MKEIKEGFSTMQIIKILLMVIIPIGAFFCFIILAEKLDTIIYYLKISV